MTFPLALLSLLPLFILLVVPLSFATDAETVVVKMDHQLASKDRASMVLIPAGQFTMGRDGAVPNEQPTHRVSLDAFYIDRYEVTVAHYAKFLESEDSEPPFLWQEARRGHNDEKPVLGVDWHDAAAYCRWAGKRLSTEAEWEKAARGGLEGMRFPWGDDETPAGVHHCNVWQGTFPSDNSAADGFYGLAPVHSFAPNGYGLFNMVGNAWEWCADWYAARRPAGDAAAPGHPPAVLTGTHRVMRGGSYLCHPSYCWRYRNAARSASTPDTATGHVGFRCAGDV